MINEKVRIKYASALEATYGHSCVELLLEQGITKQELIQTLIDANLSVGTLSFIFKEWFDVGVMDVDMTCGWVGELPYHVAELREIVEDKEVITVMAVASLYEVNDQIRHMPTPFLLEDEESN